MSPAVDDASRIALVGPDGSGKSTLLRVLAGAEPGDGGRVVRARDATVLYLLDPGLPARSSAQLSGGQRARATLAALVAARADVLLLDEPTNHLDVEALQALEAALQTWPGALVVATHDVRLSAGLRLDQVIDVVALTPPPAPGPRAPSTR